MIKTIVCNICGKLPAETHTNRLVRDHSHASGFIRGMVCDFCNNMISIYEATNPKHGRKAKMKRKYLNWLNTYKIRIEQHMNNNSGIFFTGKTHRIPMHIV